MFLYRRKTEGRFIKNFFLKKAIYEMNEASEEGKKPADFGSQGRESRRL
jgi:hypothetical protein